MWAVPTRSGRRGEFWAFFPTLDQTTLSGVVNAPWKLNEDRTRVIEGPFNAELIEQLVAAGHREPRCPLRPGRPRRAARPDARPWTRGRWLGRRGVDESASTSLRRPRGVCPIRRRLSRLPAELSLHPEGLPRPTLATLGGATDRPVDWVHVSVETRERRARADAYMDGREPASVADWLEALITRRRPRRWLQSRLSRSRVRWFGWSRVLLAQSGGQRSSWTRPASAAPSATASSVARRFPSRSRRGTSTREVEVEADEYLRNLDVRKVDTERLLEVKLRENRLEWKAPDWDSSGRSCARRASRPSWSFSRHAGSTHWPSRYGTSKGDYHSIGVLLLPGEIAHEGSVDDAKAIIDTHFHADELSTIRLFGATSGPSRETADRRNEPWFLEYRRQAETQYLEELSKSGAAPNREYLDFRDAAVRRAADTADDALAGDPGALHRGRSTRGRRPRRVDVRAQDADTGTPSGRGRTRSST